jgi:signal transduction histidine kinase
MHTFGIIVAAWILIAAAIFAFQRFFAGRSGTRPSRDAVVHAIERLAAGDYTARLEGGKGLSGDLVKSFNRMAEVLDKRFGLMEEEIGRGQGKDAETVRLEEHSSKLEEELIRTNSDLLRKEVMLEEINQELILAARVKSEFISNMGRELKTPLNTIAGLSDFVLSGSLGTLGERQREIVTDIKESASDLLDVVDNILEFTLLEMGGAINCLDFPLKAVTEEVVSSITPLAESQKVALSVDMPDAVLCADPK